MYQNFFGFREKPFKLVPNPAYLFLSRVHEEALAHLTYAVSQGEGFVQITGEVGTGKTTLCRAFLEDLNETTEAAFVFNPKLDSLQLLKTINEEFGLLADADNTKELIDALNDYLIAEKAKGKNVVLLIDEAQNLSIEVLEQIRLLSNLETTRSKLLQIILVGQPELEQMLNAPKIRQLGQRITLCCSLTPLTYSETRDYIQHRLNIASRKQGLKFPKTAVQAIYKYSKGIPRRINIACDRMLLTAFGLNKRRITAKIARSAIRELSGHIRPPGARLFEGNRGLLVFSALCLALIIVVRYPPDILDRQTVMPSVKTTSTEIRATAIKIPPQPASPPEQTGTQETESAFSELKIAAGPVISTDSEEAAIDAFNIAPALAETSASEPFKPVMLSEPVKLEKPEGLEVKFEEPATLPIEDFGDWLLTMREHITRKDAITAALNLWKIDLSIFPHLDRIEDNQTFFRMASQHNGFICQSVTGDLELIRTLNLPAIIELLIPDGSSHGYMTVKKMEGEAVTLAAGGLDPVVVSLEQVKTFWTGVALVPWKNFLSCTGEIPNHAPRDSVVTLKMMLTDMGFSDIVVNPDYDKATQEAVKKIQVKNGILPDGVVGPFTKIILYNEHGSFEIPHIRANGMEAS